jgi:hypothetical protein
MRFFKDKNLPTYYKGMPPTKTQDLSFGLESEARNKSLVEIFFGCPLRKTGTFDAMDMTNEANTIYVEMKTRRVNHDRYPTALIGKNKIDFCEKSGANCYIVYVYLDGIFYIQYDKKLFDTFDCEMYERGQREGGIQPKQLFYFIPHTHLTPFVCDKEAS